MKIEKIERDANYFTVYLTPNRIERFFGDKEKIRKFKTYYATFVSGGGYVYYDEGGNRLGNGDHIGNAIDKFIRKSEF